MASPTFVDNLDRAAEQLVGEVPDPGRPVAEHDAAGGLLEAAGGAGSTTARSSPAISRPKAREAGT